MLPASQRLFTTITTNLQFLFYSTVSEALLRPQGALRHLRVVHGRELQRDPQEVPGHGRQDLWMSVGQNSVGTEEMVGA